MSIKHLKSRSKWEIFYYKIIDFFKKKNSIQQIYVQHRYVTCETREIKCTVTREMVQDLECFYQIDAAEELEKLLQENGYKIP